METVALKEEYYAKNARTSKILHRYVYQHSLLSVLHITIICTQTLHVYYI